MRSAFKRGVELLGEPEFDPVQGQGQTAENRSGSAPKNMEGICGVPKHAAQLKPEAIDELTRKVIMMIAI